MNPDQTPTTSSHLDDVVTELAGVRADIDRLTARRRDLEKILTHELDTGTHTLAGLRVQITTPRTLDKKAFEAAHPPAQNPGYYTFTPTLNLDEIKHVLSPADLDGYKVDGTTRITLR